MSTRGRGRSSLTATPGSAGGEFIREAASFVKQASSGRLDPREMTQRQGGFRGNVCFDPAGAA